MSDYSDLFFLLGAIAIYAILVTATNRTMLQNNTLLTSTEMEYGAVSVAQNVIEKARWMSYSNATEGNLENINQDSLYNVEVNIEEPFDVDGSEKLNKKINIIVSSPYITNANGNSSNVTMSYIKTDRN